MFQKLLALPLVAAALALSSPVSAQDYPSRPITLVVGFAAGGGTDAVARIVADKLSAKLKQTVVVDNKPGAAGTLAGGLVSRATPDGYTVWLATQGPLVVAPVLQDPTPYNPLTDFKPVSLIAQFPLQMYVNDNFPAKTFKEFVELVKANPGKYTYATAGIGGPGHMMAELLSREVGLQMRHVPYAGDGLSAVDVISGVVPVWFTGNGAAPHIGPGKVRGMVTFGAEREKHLPDVPTVIEAGFPQAEGYTFNAMMGPKDLPDDIVATLNAAIAEVYEDPDLQAKFLKIATTPKRANAEETAQYIKDDVAKWHDIVSAMKVKK